MKFKKKFAKAKQPFAIKIKTVDGSIKWVPRSSSPVESTYNITARCFINVTKTSAKQKELTDITLEPGEFTIAKTGFMLNLTPGWEAQIRTKHDLAIKYGILVQDSPSTIGCNNKDEISVIIINSGDEDVSLQSGSEIATMVITKVPHVKLWHVEEFGYMKKTSQQDQFNEEDEDEEDEEEN